MEEKGRFEILVCPENGDGVHNHIMKMVEAGVSGIKLETREVPHVESAVELLLDGHGDMVAVSGSWWYANRSKDLDASIILPRREPTRVLVSEDKPEYIPFKGIVIADCEIVRRQFIRARPDVKVKLIEDFDVPEGVDHISWMEDERLAGRIDGYILPRSVHANLSFRTRRHTLGLQRDNPERYRFVPIPLDGYTILLSRKDFPAKSFSQVVDAGAAVSLRLEMMLLDNIDEKMHDLIGLMVERRKVGTVLREASKAGDDLANRSIINPKGEVKGSSNRIDIVLETISKDGTITASVERVFSPEESHSSTIVLINEWENLLEIMRETPEEEKRGRIKELMDIYTNGLIEDGRISEDRINEPLFKSDDH